MSSSSSKSFVNFGSAVGSQSSNSGDEEYSMVSSTSPANEPSDMPAIDEMLSLIPSDAEELDVTTFNMLENMKLVETEKSGEKKTSEEIDGTTGGESSDIERLNSIIKSLQEKVASQEDQIFDILVENSVLKDQVEQKEKRENSAHLQLVMNLQQTIVDQAMTMKDQNLKIKILTSQLETLKLTQVEEAKPTTHRSEQEQSDFEKQVRALKIKHRLRELKIERPEEFETVMNALKNQKTERKISPEAMKALLERAGIVDSATSGTSAAPKILDQQSLLSQSKAILDPETLKSKLDETQKLLSENSTSSVLEQKILEVEYANQQISMIIETNDLQRAEDDSRREEEKQALRDKIEDLEKVIECLKKI